MKTTIQTLLFLFLTCSLYAQVPESLNYQAVAGEQCRGVALVNQTIKVRMTLLRKQCVFIF